MSLSSFSLPMKSDTAFDKATSSARVAGSLSFFQSVRSNVLMLSRFSMSKTLSSVKNGLNEMGLSSV